MPLYFSWDVKCVALIYCTCHYRLDFIRICEGCGIATLSISYYDIGYRAGEMAYEILVDGKDISTMEIESAPKVTKMYNKTICDELGITVPDDYEAIEE